MVVIGGASLLAIVATLYARYHPPIRSHDFQMTALSAAFAVITMICPLHGWYTLLGLACQAVMGVSLVIIYRETRIANQETEHKAKCKQMREKMEMDSLLDYWSYQQGVRDGKQGKGKK